MTAGGARLVVQALWHPDCLIEVEGNAVLSQSMYGAATEGFLIGRQPSQIDPAAILLPPSKTPLFRAAQS